MHAAKTHYLSVLVLIFYFIIISCNNNNNKNNTGTAVVSNAGQAPIINYSSINEFLQVAIKNNGKIDDSTKLSLTAIVDTFYNSVDYKPVWSNNKKWQSLTDTLLNFIRNAELQGLFPKDYHFAILQSLKNELDKDSLKKIDEAVWLKTDIIFTDAFIQLTKDLRQGRLLPDSVTIDKNIILKNSFYVKTLTELLNKKQFYTLVDTLQPTHKNYWELKKGIKNFLDSMDRRTYTYVTYPFKKGDVTDSVYFVKTLQKRLSESGVIVSTNKLLDSSDLSVALKKYQLQKGIKADGKISSGVIRVMNISDAERFKRIAITLDRYKQLPRTMPEKYIWVNLPGYYLWLINHDTVFITSKIICGKQDTRTPLLNSKITDMVTYPTWTVPNSIILKSYLPKLKKNPGYLSRIGIKLVNGHGKEIEGSGIDWAKYTRGIPYRVMQNSGDNNALGIYKFNFNNPYAVYLHDTNQRYLFKNASRALSHGCVRVQEWEKLAYFIARNDSINTKITDTLRYNTDSIKNWIARKVNHRIDVKNEIPIFIRYFTCELKDGKIKFYDDIYGEDKLLREKYFSNK